MSGSAEARLAGLAALAHGDSRGFSFEEDGRTSLGFVLRLGEAFYAYRNSCPHWNVDLDLGFGDFYAADLDHVFCRNHGALFAPTTGECVFGPCVGQRLSPLDVHVDGGDLIVRIPAS
ncbi:MAG: Rieske 2Fe-2S domain-containing protein [Polyangiales bacterium]